MSELRNIDEILAHLQSAVYGREVRADIVDAVRRTYQDGKAGATDLEARAEIQAILQELGVAQAAIDSIIALPDGATTADAELTDIRIGYDGTTYASAGDAVRGQAGAIRTANNAVIASVEELKSEMGAVEYDENPATLTWTQDKVYSVENGKVKVNTEGELQSWYAADPVTITDQTRINAKWYMAGLTTYPFIIITNGAGNVLYAENGTADAVFETNIKIPYGATTIYFNHRLAVNYNRPATCTFGRFKAYKYAVEAEPFFINLAELKKALSIDSDIVTISTAGTTTLTYPASAITQNIIVECEATATGAATIQFAIDDIYRTPKYTIGEGINKKWRIPKPPTGAQTVKATITNPADSVITVRLLQSTLDSSKALYHHGLRLNAHLGFALYPQSTMLGFVGAANAGFSACIAPIRQTADGVYVCIHNATINATARDSEGDSLVDTINVADSTYAELLEYDFGIYKSPIYAGEKIPTAEQFFKLCAKTGMCPIISTKISSAEIWQDIKDMVARYGLLSVLHVKAFTADNLRAAYAVLGDDIDGYTLDRSSNTISSYEGNITTLQGIFGEAPKVRVGIEYVYSELSNAIAPTACKAIIDAGMFVAAFDAGVLTGAEYDRLSELGISEITEDVNCSSGLNW